MKKKLKKQTFFIEPSVRRRNEHQAIVDWTNIYQETSRSCFKKFQEIKETDCLIEILVLLHEQNYLWTCWCNFFYFRSHLRMLGKCYIYDVFSQSQFFFYGIEAPRRKQRKRNAGCCLYRKKFYVESMKKKSAGIQVSLCSPSSLCRYGSNIFN